VRWGRGPAQKWNHRWSGCDDPRGFDRRQRLPSSSSRHSLGAHQCDGNGRGHDEESRSILPPSSKHRRQWVSFPNAGTRLPNPRRTLPSSPPVRQPWLIGARASRPAPAGNHDEKGRRPGMGWRIRRPPQPALASVSLDPTEDEATARYLPDSGEHIRLPDRQDVQRHQERQRPQGGSVPRYRRTQFSPDCLPGQTGPGAVCTNRESASTWLALTYTRTRA
jgi:hypothetical protein